MMGAIGGSAAGIILTGAVIVLLVFAGRHGSRLPARAHPWVYRLLIFGMYTGGCAIVLSALGTILTGWEAGALGMIGNISSGAGHEVIVIGGFVIFLAAFLGFVLEPGPQVAWFALALPFVAVLAGGHLHGVLTVFPVAQWAAQVSAWIGG